MVWSSIGRWFESGSKDLFLHFYLSFFQQPDSYFFAKYIFLSILDQYFPFICDVVIKLLLTLDNHQNLKTDARLLLHSLSQVDGLESGYEIHRDN